MHHDAARYEDPVAYLYVTGQRDVVGDNHTVAQPAIMRDMRVSHQVTIRTDGGDRTRLSAAMNGHAFTNRTAVADTHVAFAGGEGEVLRFAADDGAFVNHIILADGGEAFDAGVGANFRAVADTHVAFDYGIRADGDVVAELRAGADNGCRVNVHDKSDYYT